MLVKSILSTLAVSVLAGSAVARPLEHAHHLHAKRDVVYVTETNVVTVVAGQTVPTTTSAYAEAAASTSLAAESVETTKAAAAAAAASSSSSGSSSSGSSKSSGSFSGAKGITYSPYEASGACKTLSAVQSDLKTLSGYEIIRLYGVDCDQVANVLQAKADGQKLFLGIYFVDAIADGVSTIAAAIEAHGSWDDVYTVSIGNELVNSGQASVSEVGSLVAAGKSALTAAGYTGPVVSVDTFIAVINNPGLCEFSDYIAVNAHAFFDGGILPADAGKWVVEQLQRVATACDDSKDVFITESGWPTKGETNGVAVPSAENQATAISAIVSAAGNDCTLFTAFNDLWKADGAFAAEKYWGIYSS